MTILDALAVFGRLHPLVLHLPIGLIAGVAMLEALAIVRPRLTLRPAIGILVWLAALAAAFSATSGWVLAGEESYSGDTLELHRWLGIALASVALLTAIAHLRVKAPSTSVALYRIGLVATLVLMLPAGHYGGSLTRGEGFLLAPLEAQRERPVAAPAVQLSAFDATVRPTFEANCVGCHNATKKKGGLSLVDSDAIIAGSDNGEVLVAGDVANSEIVRRLRLPLDDDDHMPPEGKRQPSDAEIGAIEAWITDGASFTAASTAPPAVQQPTQAGVESPTAPAPTPIPIRARADDLAALQSALVHFEPVAPDSSLFMIDFAGPANSRLADDAFVARLLRPLASFVQDLSLAGSGVSDATLELVATMPNLRRLDLRATAITDAGVAKLGRLVKLEELNLVRTATSDSSIEVLLTMPALRRTFLWSSAMTPEGLRRLRDAKHNLLADAGDSPDSKALDVEPAVELGKTPPSNSTAPTTAPVVETASLRPINTVCPVAGTPIDPRYTIVYEGKVIGFCCPNCPKKFWDDPKAFLDKLK